MRVPQSEKPPSLLFRSLRAGYVAGVLGCTVMQMIARQTVHDLIPLSTSMNLALFLAGAAWVSWSNDAERSDSLKLCIYLSFLALVAGIFMPPMH